MRQSNYQQTIESLQQVFEFPRNLEIESDSRTGIANYWIARCFEQMGNPEEAKKYDQKMIGFETLEGWGGEKLSLIDFYGGLSQEKMGNTGKAKEIYRRLMERSEKMLNRKPEEGLALRSIKVRQEYKNQQSEGYFIRGLAYWGLDDKINALSSFRKARDIQPDLLDAKLFTDRKLPL